MGWNNLSQKKLPLFKMKIKLHLLFPLFFRQNFFPFHLCLTPHPLLSPQSPTCVLLIILVHSPSSNHSPLSSSLFYITCQSSFLHLLFPQAPWRDFWTGFRLLLLYHSVVNQPPRAPSTIPEPTSGLELPLLFLLFSELTFWELLKRGVCVTVFRG